jgi:hypothetical protein
MMLYRNDQPCWYELTMPNIHRPDVGIRVHNEFIQANPLPADMPILKAMAKFLPPERFVGKFDDHFGYDGCFRYVSRNGDYTEFSVSLPQVSKTGKNCEMCKGTGQDEILERECLYCQGQKVQTEYDWTEARAMSATFTVLTFLLRYPEGITTSPHKQLLTIHTSTPEFGGSLGGEFSPHMVKWLSRFGSSVTLPIMEEAMRTAWNHMMQPRTASLDHNQFRASIDGPNGWLNINCPGHACGLNPHYSGIREGQGYQFTDHNIDNTAQQLTLIAGLAALGDMARRKEQ